MESALSNPLSSGHSLLIWPQDFCCSILHCYWEKLRFHVYRNGTIYHYTCKNDKYYTEPSICSIISLHVKLGRFWSVNHSVTILLLFVHTFIAVINRYLLVYFTNQANKHFPVTTKKREFPVCFYFAKNFVFSCLSANRIWLK